MQEGSKGKNVKLERELKGQHLTWIGVVKGRNKGSDNAKGMNVGSDNEKGMNAGSEGNKSGKKIETSERDSVLHMKSRKDVGSGKSGEQDYYKNKKTVGV